MVTIVVGIGITMIAEVAVVGSRGTILREQRQGLWIGLIGSTRTEEDGLLWRGTGFRARAERG